MNDFEKLSKKMEQGFINLADLNGINTNTAIKETQAAEKRLGGKIDALHQNTSQGFINLADVVGVHAHTVIEEGKQSEKRIINKINSIKGAALKTSDYVVILIMTILAGIGGFFYSKCMINNGTSAWVNTTQVMNKVTDAAGNLSDITYTTTSEPVWATVVVTIVFFALIGMALSYLVVSDLRDKEG